jgi:hypothetical protein
MMGWEEIADAMAEVYSSLPPEERARAAILAPNYSIAGRSIASGRSAVCPARSAATTATGSGGPAAPKQTWSSSREVGGTSGSRIGRVSRSSGSGTADTACRAAITRTLIWLVSRESHSRSSGPRFGTITDPVFRARSDARDGLCAPAFTRGPVVTAFLAASFLPYPLSPGTGAVLVVAGALPRCWTPALEAIGEFE